MNKAKIHEDYHPDWETPPQWVEWVKGTLGGKIDLDPCCGQRTFAKKNLGPAQDGLEAIWRGRVYCNPPGKQVKDFWIKSAGYISRTHQPSLVFCFFNNEHIRQVQPSPWSTTGFFVIPDKRIKFYKGGLESSSPPQWAWFWTNKAPALTPPMKCWVVPTGTETNMFIGRIG